MSKMALKLQKAKDKHLEENIGPGSYFLNNQFKKPTSKGVSCFGSKA